MVRRFQKECESSCEYILPDYLGDVKRVLFSTARAVPSAEFDTDTAHESAGVVLYEMVYLDSDNKISTASFSSDYDLSFPVSEETNGVYVSTTVFSSSERLMGPRRISAKSRLVSDVVMSCPVSENPEGTALSDEESPVSVSKSVMVENVLFGEELAREYSEQIASLEESFSEDIEIITSSANVKIESTEVVDGGVNIKGVLIVTAIVKSPEMSVFAIKREIPFDETVSLEGATPSMSALAEGTLTNVTTSLEETEGSVSVNASVSLSYKALVFDNESRELTLDAYLKNKNTTQEYETIKFNEYILAKNTAAEGKMRLCRSVCGMENLSEIVSLNIEYKTPELIKDGFGLIIKVDALISGIACEINEDGERSLVPVKCTAPAEFYVKLSCQLSDAHELCVKMKSLGAEWNIDADSVYITPSVSLDIYVFEQKSERVLKSCNISAEDELFKNSSRICVYYPDGDETLFEIAKKFHSTAAEIAKDNELNLSVSEDGTPFELTRGFDKLIIR